MVAEKDITNVTVILTVLWGLGSFVGLALGTANVGGIAVPIIVGLLGAWALIMRHQHKLL